ncbi:MAG: DUF5103 domain-containing protein, partial [Capnocytophaga granulosa]
DDLRGGETDYYYTLTHCNYDWQPSGLLKSEYLRGMDDVRLTQYHYSYGTLQPYTHYNLTLPNDDTDFLLTGNYLLTITDSEQRPIFTRRFVLYSPTATVQLSVKQSREVKYAETRQSVQMKISSKSLQFVSPNTAVKVTILQNYRWDNAIMNVPPQYILGNDLVYKYDRETSFWGGNEYFYFENRDLRSPTSGVYTTRREGDKYFCQLFTQVPRAHLPYTYNPDIDGNFRIVSDHGRNNSIEGEYALVQFSLSAKDLDPSDELYVYGAFSDNALTKDYQLLFDEEQKVYVGNVYLKQGFYNYKFALKHNGQADYNAIGGNFYQTENTYTVLVYYRDTADRYDRVIGMGSLQSTQVTR